MALSDDSIRMIGPLPKSATLRIALEEYRVRVSILKKGYLQERYRILQISNSFLGEMEVREITSVHIAKYRDTRLVAINAKTHAVISQATVRLEMSLLSNFFDIARIEWGIAGDNPVKNVRKPKTSPGRDRRLSAREERLILRYCANYSNHELYSIVVLALETAMRQGEILGLRWENVNLKTRIAHLPETKNGSKRDIPLSVKAKDVLMRVGIKSSGNVFNYSNHGLKTTWRVMLMKIGIQDLHFHDLRHEAVSRLFELGTLDMMEVAAISGHKSLSMLKRYTHLRAQKLVTKLDGVRHKGRQQLLSHLLPYPAVVESSASVDTSKPVLIRILDFDDLSVRACSQAAAIELAQDKLLRRILQHIQQARPLPPPDQYLNAVDETELLWIDPMGSAAAVDTFLT